MRRSLRSATAVVASLLFAGVATTATGAPADLFNGSASRADAPGPDGEKLDTGDWGVAKETGAATYTVPIAVPPGRRGMAPSLALRYSSQGALRGGVAVGWSLELPKIEVDRTSLLAGGTPVYQASLGGKSGRLIPVSETPAVASATTYRLDFDDSFIRFERLTCSSGCRKGWLARTADGTRYYFDDAVSGFGGGRRWNLTEQVDAFGNSITYSWLDAVVDDVTRANTRRLASIEYGRNVAAGVAHHARVVFDYAAREQCSGLNTPIGASVEYDDAMAGYATPEWGRYYEGAYRLTAIRTEVKDAPGGAYRQARTYGLAYDMAAMSCNQEGAPLRYLTRIDVTGRSADGLTTTAPPMTFTYGRHLRQLSHTTTLSPGGYPERGTLDGVDSAYVDYDGDGLLDIASVNVNASGKCELQWKRGNRNGSFTPQTPRALPTAKWSNGTSPTGLERCNWIGQINFATTTPLLPGCPFRGHRFGYRWIDWNKDGRLDLWTTAWLGGYYVPSLDGGVTGRTLRLDDDPGSEPRCDYQTEREPEHDGVSHGVRIYLQNGDGSINPIPQWVTLTNPLPPPGVDGTLSTAANVGHSLPPLVDMNGDGYLDLLNISPGSLGSGGTFWTVRLGDGSTGFGSAKSWSRPTFSPLRGSTGFSTDGYGGYTSSRRDNGVALRDVNGDGLPDLLVESKAFTYAGIGAVTDGMMIAFLNTGRGFGNEPMKVSVNGTVDTQLVIGSDYDAYRQLVRDGWNGSWRRFADLDGDGLLDQIILYATHTNIAAAGPALVSYGVGGGFLPARSRPGVDPLKRLYRADDFVWSVRTDYADADGDGLEDLITWNDSTGSSVGELGSSGPMRLMTQAATGRGAVVRFNYALSTESSATSGVGSPRWLVREVALDPGLGAAGGQPTIATQYSYSSPNIGTASNRPGERRRFLGFERVTTTHSSGSRQVTTYQYGVTVAGLRDGSGRVSTVENWSVGAGGAETLDTVSSISYAAQALFTGQVAFAYPQTTITRICAPNTTWQTASTCRNQTTDLMRVTETWEPRELPCTIAPCFAYPYLGVKTMREESSALIPAMGDRRTVLTYEHRIGQAPYTTLDYRVLPTSSEVQEAYIFNGSPFWAMVAKDITGYSPAGLPVTTTKLVDGSQSAITTQTFDSVGHAVTVRKPNQQPSGPVTTLAYDPHKLFVASTTNELGHVSTATFDYGTGQQRRVTGPRGSGSVRENTEWTRDGLGRVTERRVGTGASFTPTAVERNTYLDSVIPNRIATSRLIAFGGTTWTSASRDVDGAGRVVRTTETHAGGNTVATYTYNAAGTVQYVDTPDPRVDTGATVRSSYTFDAQGRLTSFRAPDGAGVDMFYDRRSRRATEYVAGNGVAASKTTRTDAFGRLVEVREHQPGAFDAVTKYEYDAAGRLRAVTDADNGLTRFGHDYAGRRTSINRQGRWWSYIYDRNGNATQAIAPVPSGAAQAEYTTTSTYDALDRMLTRTPARRGQTDATLNGLGAGPAVFTYDAGTLETGRLSTETVQRWGATTNPFVAISYDYNDLGHVSAQQWTVRPDGGASYVTGTVVRSYNALGAPTESVWDNADRWLVTYDNRALPSAVAYKPAAGTYQTLATFQRGLDGSVRTQLSPGDTTRTFTYDQLGRVKTDVVKTTFNGTPNIERARYTYEYFGDGSMKSMNGTVAGMAAAGSYEYDELGRLIFAAGPTGNHWSYEYTRAGNISHLDAMEAGVTRDLDWTYGARDPQAVDTIVSTTGFTHAAYTYDQSGNVTRRTMGAANLDLTWDGEDRLRRAAHVGSSERYLYDARGNRIATVGVTGTRVWMAEAEYFLPLSGTGSRKYLHVGAGGEPIARVEGSTTIELQHHDIQHSLFLSTSLTGAVTASFAYGPFGEVVSKTGDASHRRQFNGKEHDAVSGLRYYGARYYDAVSRRWTAGDPLYRFAPDRDLASPQRQNIYTFSLNNPIRYWDPDGLDPKVGKSLELKTQKEINEYGGRIYATFNGTKLTIGGVLASHRLGNDTAGLKFDGPKAWASVGCAKGSCGIGVGASAASIEGNWGPLGAGLMAGGELGVQGGMKNELKLVFVKLSLDVSYFVPGYGSLSWALSAAGNAPGVGVTRGQEERSQLEAYVRVATDPKISPSMNYDGGGTCSYTCDGDGQIVPPELLPKPEPEPEPEAEEEYPTSEECNDMSCDFAQ